MRPQHPPRPVALTAPSRPQTQDQMPNLKASAQSEAFVHGTDRGSLQSGTYSSQALAKTLLPKGIVTITRRQLLYGTSIAALALTVGSCSASGASTAEDLHGAAVVLTLPLDDTLHTADAAASSARIAWQVMVGDEDVDQEQGDCPQLTGRDTGHAGRGSHRSEPRQP